MKSPLERILIHAGMPAEGCWEWRGAAFRYGYGNVRVRREDGEWGNKGAHIVMYEAAYGLVPDGLFVCHECDYPPCVRPSHFFLGTQAENLADMTAKGRRANQFTTSRVGARSAVAHEGE